MAILRTRHNRENPFVQIDKTGLEDPNLSWAAKGLWTYLMSRPDNWNVSVSHLSKIYEGKGGGERAIYSLLNELIDEGYCERHRIKDEKGQFAKTEYIILELKNKVPHSSQRDVGDQHVGQPDVGKSYTNNIENKDKDINKKSSSSTTTTTTTKKKDASPLPVVVSFYECLKDSKLTDDEKMILNKFPEEEVKKAHEFIKANYEYPNTTWIQLYIWAVKYKPKTTKVKEDNIPKNKELSDMVEKIKGYPYKIESLKEGLEFSSPSGQTIEIIPYDINAGEFYGKIASRLRLTEEQLHEILRRLI